MSFNLTLFFTIGLWYAQMISKRDNEKKLDMRILNPPRYLRGHELDLWYKNKNRLWKKSKKKNSKCVSLSYI